MGDSGSGKSTLIRRLLTQIAERGESAIVYDPALEYTGQFYSPERGDIILNPLDERMPYWPIADEVIRPAEALTLAAALFPETDQGQPIFQTGFAKNYRLTVESEADAPEIAHLVKRRARTGKTTERYAARGHDLRKRRATARGCARLALHGGRQPPVTASQNAIEKNTYHRQVGGGGPPRLGFSDQHPRSQGADAGAHQHVAGHDDPAADEPGQTTITPGVVCVG